MRADDFSWRNGQVVHWDLTFLNIERPLNEQVGDLKEDLAQIRYPGDVLVDIGWYPEFSESGRFVVSVIANADWDAPLFREQASTMESLTGALEAAVQRAWEASIGN